MNALIVHAHPEPHSFTAAMKNAAEETLKKLGYAVETSDLYAQAFNPVASAADFRERVNPDYLVYALEQRNGIKNQSLSADILREVEKVQRCDLLVMTFPIFWFSMPAMLKGWIDRVFVSGVFYGGRRIYGEAGMVGKRALVGATLGGREHMVVDGGIHGSLTSMLRPLLQGTLGYAGFEVLLPFFGYHVPYVDDTVREGILHEWKEVVEGVESRSALSMPSLDDYDEHFRRR